MQRHEDPCMNDTCRLERMGPFVYQRHAPAQPALEDGTERHRHRVAIVGAGPVGLATALGLARHGVASVVIEADDSVCEGSRATCVSRRSLEIIERLGALPAFLAKGLAWSDGRSYHGNTEVFRFAMPQDSRQKLPPMINLQQYYIEQYLLDTIAEVNAAHPGTVDLRWATEVTALATQHDGMTLEVANALGSYRLRADWVVACDGGQSFVRRSLGLAMGGTAYEGRYVIIDIELPSTYPTERRAWFDPPWNRGSTVLMHKQPDDLWRIDYQLRHGVDTEAALQPAAVHAFVQRHLDAIGEGHLPWKPVWTSIYRAGAMTLDNYRHGRVLFAGNAAHAMPIFGVRGLNSGFDDADNLAWKLAEVVCHGAPHTLLDSYSSERIDAFHQNAASAMRSTEFMSPPSRGFDLLREAALTLAAAHPDIAGLINPRQTQAIRYTGSPLSSASDDFAAGPAPGAVLLDGPLQGGGGHLTDTLGPRCTCLVFTPDGRVPEAVAAFAEEQHALVRLVPISPHGPGLVDAGGQLARAYDADAGAVLLVRPDGHVAGRWRRPDRLTLDQALAASPSSRRRHSHEPAARTTRRAVHAVRRGRQRSRPRARGPVPGPAGAAAVRGRRRRGTLPAGHRRCAAGPAAAFAVRRRPGLNGCFDRPAATLTPAPQSAATAAARRRARRPARPPAWRPGPRAALPMADRQNGLRQIGGAAPGTGAAERHRRHR